MLVTLSCSKEKSLNIQKSLLRISPAINQLTKVLIDDGNISEKEIGIQITNPDGTILYSNNIDYNNLRLSKPVIINPWIFDDGYGISKEVILTNDNAKIYAYYPFSTSLVTGIGEAASLKLDIPQQQSEGYVTDYLWGAQSTTVPSGCSPIMASNSVVQIKLNHSLALVAFVIYKDGYSGSGDITRMDLRCKSGDIFTVNKDAINDLKMNLADGVISGGQMVSQISLTGLNSVILASDPGLDVETLYNNRNFEIFTVPASFISKSDIEFSLVVDGNTYIASFEGAEPLNIASGNIYVFKAKLSPKMLSIVGVQAWNEVNYDGESGYDELWYGIPPVEIAGLLWAPVNMGYDPISNPYGLFYQWNRKYGQKSTCSKIAGPVTLTEGNSIQNSNTFYTISSTPYYWYAPPDDLWSTLPQNNPCPDGWRVPANSEILALISAGSTWVNSGAGGMNNMAGRWFGGNHSTNHSGSVFIPASGRLSPTGLFQAQGTNCMMWIADKVSGEYKNLFFSNASVASQTSFIGNGLSVRCVKDL